MDALLALGLLILGALIAVPLGLMAAPNNRRIAAAWLIASAKAMDEKRAACRAIDRERREYQAQMEARLKAGRGVEDSRPILEISRG